MAYNERSSSRLASLASRAERDPASLTLDEIRELGGSVLTQTPDHRTPEMQQLLDRLTAAIFGEPPPYSNAQMAAALRMAVLGYPPGNLMARGRYPAANTIAASADFNAMQEAAVQAALEVARRHLPKPPENDLLRSLGQAFGLPETPRNRLADDGPGLSRLLERGRF